MITIIEKEINKLIYENTSLKEDIAEKQKDINILNDLVIELKRENKKFKKTIEINNFELYKKPKTIKINKYSLFKENIYLDLFIKELINNKDLNYIIEKYNNKIRQKEDEIFILSNKEKNFENKKKQLKRIIKIYKKIVNCLKIILLYNKYR